MLHDIDNDTLTLGLTIYHESAKTIGEWAETIMDATELVEVFANIHNTAHLLETVLAHDPDLEPGTDAYKTQQDSYEAWAELTQTMEVRIIALAQEEELPVLFVNDIPTLSLVMGNYGYQLMEGWWVNEDNIVNPPEELATLAFEPAQPVVLDTIKRITLNYELCANLDDAAPVLLHQEECIIDGPTDTLTHKQQLVNGHTVTNTYQVTGAMQELLAYGKSPDFTTQHHYTDVPYYDDSESTTYTMTVEYENEPPVTVSGHFERRELPQGYSRLAKAVRTFIRKCNESSKLLGGR